MFKPHLLHLVNLFEISLEVTWYACSGFMATAITLMENLPKQKDGKRMKPRFHSKANEKRGCFHKEDTNFAY